MKLLIQHRHAADEISGVLTYTTLIASELKRRDVEIKVISTTQDSIDRWLAAIQWADLVHMNSNDLIFALICKLLGKKILIKYHYLFYQSLHSDYEFMPFPKRLKTEVIHTLPKSNYPLRWKLFTLIKWARLSIRIITGFLSDYRLACSQFLAESYAFPRPILPLYNPVQLPPAAAPKSLSDLSDPYTFIFVGRFHRDKGVDILLQATHQLQQRRQDFQVLIVGDGPNRATIQQLAIDLQITDRVQFLGKLSHPELLPILRSALAVVVPSRWQEPAGYVVQEAASVQTGAIVSRVGGLPEMAGPTGLFFTAGNVAELANLMQDCLENPEQTLERGHTAYQYAVDRFSPGQAAEDLLKLCWAAIGAGRLQAPEASHPAS